MKLMIALGTQLSLGSECPSSDRWVSFSEIYFMFAQPTWSWTRVTPLISSGA